MNVAILGMGKLGVPMAAFYASVGHKVTGVDIDDALIERLLSGTFHTAEPEVETLLKAHRDRLTFTRLPYEAVLKADIVFVVVPTPSKPDGTFTSAYVVTACQQIGTALHDKDAYTLVVVVSTLMPGQMDAEVVPSLERASGKQAGIDFGVCYSPEFIALGRVVAGLRKPDYTLIGEQPGAEAEGYFNVGEHHGVGRAGYMLAEFYTGFAISPQNVRRMSFVNAELAKLATNAYLSLKIAYANVLGQICENIPGANVDVVTQAVGSDHRIGGAYLRAGLPAGGVCLPRDLEAIAQITPADLFDGITFWNKDYFQQITRAIERRLKRTDTIAILGTAYSATTSLRIVSWGYALEHALKDSGYDVTFCIRDDGAQALVDTADAVILALPLDSYKALTFHAPQKVFDIWRVLDPAQRPEGVSLWQLGIGAQNKPVKAEFQGEPTMLSAPFGGFLTQEQSDAAGLVDASDE